MGEDDDQCPRCHRIRRDVEPQFNLGSPLGIMCSYCADQLREPGTELRSEFSSPESADDLADTLADPTHSHSD